MGFFSFFQTKTITNKKALGIGFVLAVLSLFVMAFAAFAVPAMGYWLNSRGVVELDFFLMIFVFFFTCALQALILFGFPLYYARDAKTHMTGFRILLFTLLWSLVLFLLVALIAVKMHTLNTAPYSLDSFPDVSDETAPAPLGQ